jgi:LytS/YehU family sensor histidine kinase
MFSALEAYERSNIAIALWLGTVGDSVVVQHVCLSVFPWWGNMIAAALMLLANNLICVFYRAMQKEEDEERLQRQNVQAEMYYLKHQINPHFLMNTLNNIHALIDIDLEAAKSTVIQLSDMMRYVVYDTGGNNIALKEDLKFIKNYIELMRIRYTDDVNITFNYPKHLTGTVDVPPLIFIVFVENAFKHGVSYKSKSFIDVNIEYENGYVTATFENSVNEQSRTSAPGIGLENVRKRLDLIYEDRYDLRVEDKGETYCVMLKIPTLNGDKMHSN